jgi:hypothetical protein
MADISLEFIAQKLDQVLIEQRRTRDDLRYLRQEFSLMREQVRIQGGELVRLSDTIAMDVLERLRKLEEPSQ